jgi:DNA-binding response OmpR family regulator
MKVLLVEDDAQVGQALQQVLSGHDYAATWVRTAEDAKRFLAAEEFDMLLFDIVLPGESGLALLTWARAQSIDSPILMLTARDGVTDRVMGLDSGADDYLAKPFALDELLSRMRALLRRRSPQKSAMWTVGDVAIDTARRQVSVRQQPVPLSKREYDLLLKLATTPGKVITRVQLARGSDAEDVAESNAVDVHIYSLRKKLGSDVISTVRGIGYVLEEAVR